MQCGRCGAEIKGKLAYIGEHTVLCVKCAGIETARVALGVNKEPPVHVLEIHHAYIGVGMFLVGFILMMVSGELFWPRLLVWAFAGISALGLVIALDDLIQHLVQILWKPSYQSPVHRAWEWLVRTFRRER